MAWVCRALLAALILGGVAFPSVARAGCPNVCELTASEPVLAPPLPCASLEAKPEGCDCGVALSVGNGCGGPIDAVDFQFDSCWGSSPQPEFDCITVDPDKTGKYKARLGELGTRELSFQLQSGGVEHTLTVSATVTSLGSDGSCSFRPPAPQRRGDGLGLLGLALVGLGMARRALRRGAPRRGLRAREASTMSGP